MFQLLVPANLLQDKVFCAVILDARDISLFWAIESSHVGQVFGILLDDCHEQQGMVKSQLYV